MRNNKENILSKQLLHTNQTNINESNNIPVDALVSLPDEPFTHLDLFSGIGGFALAAKSTWEERYENIGFCEIDTFCHKVLRKNFGNDIRIFEDIKLLDGKQFVQPDLLTGGFPCQDISIAGIRNGRKELDGQRSGLFYEMIRIIDESKPRYILYENSPMIMGETIKAIHNILSELNYVNAGRTITAREFGFPHKRQRYYGISIAHSVGIGLNEAEIKIRKYIEDSRQTILRDAENRKNQFSRTFSDSLSSPSNSVILRSFDGIPTRLDVDRVKALGNSIVPQIAELLLAAIKTIDDNLIKLKAS